LFESQGQVAVLPHEFTAACKVGDKQLQVK
jgi:hypothetical protein